MWAWLTLTLLSLVAIIMTSFVSEREIEAKRKERKEQRRNAREEILRDAKEKFLKERRLKELRELRGEDTWLAAGVSSRLAVGRASRPLSDEPKKKRTHDKKEKKHKRSKKHSRKEEGDESESNKEDELVWVEKGADSTSTEEETQPGDAEQHATLVRDEWMQVPVPPSAGAMDRLAQLAESSTFGRKQKKEGRTEVQSLSSFDQPGKHPLELNPYWKDGGCGLSETTEGAPSNSKTNQINDGGRSWLLRSYKRALEKVEEGASIEEIAADRWGSLEKLYSLLEEAGIDPKNPDKRPNSNRRDYLYSHFNHDRRERRDHEGRERRGYDLYKQEQGRDYSSIRGERRERRGYDFDKQKRNHDYSSSRGSREMDLMKPRSSGGFMKPSENEDEGSNARHHDGLGWKDGGIQSSQSWRKKQPNMTNIKPTSAAGSTLSTTTTSPSSIVHQSVSPLAVAGPSSMEEKSSAVSSKPVTDSQLNALAAKVMKAELMGNTAKVEKLKDELQKLRQLKQEQSQGTTVVEQQALPHEKTVVLAKTDRFGRIVPIQTETGATSDPFQSRKSRHDTHTSKGKRRKYFADDDHYSLQDLVRQEMTMTAEETHAAIARMASKFIPAANSEETVDDALDSKAMLRHDPQKEATKQKLRAMAESRKMTQILEECKLCFGNSGFEKHLLIAVGLNTYLSVPATQPLTECHCYIVPMEHAACSLHLDENVWSEINIFRKGLTRMFSDHGMDVVFMEMYSSVRRKSHAYIECIPLPKEVGELAPMYFKKAIMESDEEWSDNKKLIDTSKKGVRGSVPLGLPYFFVEFGMDGGYGHIVEDQSKFPHYFGREVCGGMLDAEPRLWLKPHRESFERQKRRVVQLSEWWTPYDWTQKLKEEST